MKIGPCAVARTLPARLPAGPSSRLDAEVAREEKAAGDRLHVGVDRGKSQVELSFLGCSRGDFTRHRYDSGVQAVDHLVGSAGGSC